MNYTHGNKLLLIILKVKKNNYLNLIYQARKFCQGIGFLIENKKNLIKIFPKSYEDKNATLPTPKSPRDDMIIKKVLQSKYSVWSNIVISEKSCTGSSPIELKNTSY